MTLFQLYTDCKVDGVVTVSDFTGEADQNAYYDSLARYSFYADFVKLGEPFLISKSLEDALAYKYGRMKIKSKWFYFSIDNAIADTEGQTWIHYTVDAWETARYQYGARLGRGTVFKARTSSHPQQGYQPITTVRDLSPVDSGSEFEAIYLIAFIHKSEGNVNKIVAIDSAYASHIFSGAWVHAIGYNDSDVTFAALSPFKPYKFALVENPGLPYLEADLDNIPLMQYARTFSKTLYTNDVHESALTDMREVDIFQVPYGVTLDRGFTATLNVTANSCNWDLRLSDTIGNVYQVNVPCEPIDVFIDQYAEYFARSRDQDIATRRLQIYEGYKKGQLGAVQGALSGGIAGASGGPIGAIVGAVSGGAGTFASAYVNKRLEEGLMPKYQNITDNQYYKAVDTLSMTGSLTATFILGFRRMRISTYDWDQFSADRFVSDTTEFGYTVNIATGNAEEYYRPGPLAGDFEITGVPDDWKAQIRARFNGGVKIVN